MYPDQNPLYTILQTPFVPIAAGVFLIYLRTLVSWATNRDRVDRRFPLVNGKRPWEFLSTNAKSRFAAGAKDLISQAFQEFTNGFRLLTDSGEVIVLDVEHAAAIKDNDKLSFGPMLQRILDPRSTILDMTTQISSRIFLGKEVCRNPEWRRVTISYTVDSIRAAQQLRLWPSFTRKIVHWFLPLCRQVRGHLEKARQIIRPVLAQRRGTEAKTKRGHPDALDWLEQASKGRAYDPAVAQVMLSLAAAHTLSDMTVQLLFDLAQRPALINILREEIVAMSRNHAAWSKAALYDLKLMDSVMKESQRLKPAALVALRREATARTKLPDGTSIPKGTTVMVSAHRMWDSSTYKDAAEFDGYRFLEMRSQPGREYSAQVSATSQDHIGFGFGKAACPGRFFAIHLLKIFLCHLLMQYDIRLADDTEPKSFTNGFFFLADPTAQLSVRRREKGFDFFGDNL
ncbi:hypothetical protein D6D01_02196 [Aureobasidium pullulans]|uniref:Cytochrome P450 n=1 Tax=Aureobasidium pullulans TaxID=5580 RepID=A0A4S9LUU8_AURPU|nr:hypothetical protein D6D01_02196 [Aureobasidium pullulans]